MNVILFLIFVVASLGNDHLNSKYSYLINGKIPF